MFQLVKNRFDAFHFHHWEGRSADRAAFQEDADFGQAHQALLKALEKVAQFI